ALADQGTYADGLVRMAVDPSCHRRVQADRRTHPYRSIRNDRNSRSNIHRPKYVAQSEQVLCAFRIVQLLVAVREIVQLAPDDLDVGARREEGRPWIDLQLAQEFMD